MDGLRHLAVPQSEEVQADDGSTFTAFAVEVSLASAHKYTLLKRYSELHSFHASLLADPAVQALPFPEKQVRRPSCAHRRNISL